MVPTHFERLLALPARVRDRYDVSSLRLVAHTGAACRAEVKRAMIDWWGPVVLEAYGGTEVGTVCSITSEEWLARPGSVGRALPPFEALVVDDRGDAVPVGREGRLYFEDTTGRGVVYRSDPGRSAEAHLRPGVSAPSNRSARSSTSSQNAVRDAGYLKDGSATTALLLPSPTAVSTWPQFSGTRGRWTSCVLVDECPPDPYCDGYHWKRFQVELRNGTGEHMNERGSGG